MWSSSITSPNDRSASFHDLNDAAWRFDYVNETAILASTLYGRTAKSRDGAGFSDPKGASAWREPGILSLDDDGDGLEMYWPEAEWSVWWWWTCLAARSSALESSNGRAVKQGLPG
ncbi:DNA replication complex GINS protein PSF2 [Psidium guajava]|nr:DNA replication complex GINS protein PSF2 [Psidium guajava]